MIRFEHEGKRNLFDEVVALKGILIKKFHDRKYRAVPVIVNSVTLSSMKIKLHIILNEHPPPAPVTG